MQPQSEILIPDQTDTDEMSNPIETQDFLPTEHLPNNGHLEEVQNEEAVIDTNNLENARTNVPAYLRIVNFLRRSFRRQNPQSVFPVKPDFDKMDPLETQSCLNLYSKILTIGLHRIEGLEINPRLLQIKINSVKDKYFAETLHLTQKLCIRKSSLTPEEITQFYEWLRPKINKRKFRALNHNSKKQIRQEKSHVKTWLIDDKYPED